MPPSYLQLDPDETILLTVHRHIISILPIFISTTLILLFTAYALGWLSTNSDRVPAVVPVAVIGLGLVLLGALAVIILILAYSVFRQNRIILTNRHYLQISQNGLFSRTVSKLTLDEIQDVRGTKHGLLPTILNYGEILIETAGTEPNFLFRPVGDPFDVAEIINDSHQRYGHTPPSTTPTSPSP